VELESALVGSVELEEATPVAPELAPRPGNVGIGPVKPTFSAGAGTSGLYTSEELSVDYGACSG